MRHRQAPAKGRKFDTGLVATAFALIVFGLIALSSAGVVVSFQRFGEANFFFKQQFVSFLVGLAVFFVLAKIDYHVWKRFAIPFMVVALGLLVAVLIPGVGFEAGGARRWLPVGSFQFQPSEVMKLVFILYLAVWLEKRGKAIKDFVYGFLPFLALLALIVVLIMKEPDLGTVSIVVLISILMYFVAGARKRHLAAFGVGAVIVLALLISFAPYRVDRLTVFLNPELDPQGVGYHINQSLLAIGSGGLFGVGLGHSNQKYNYLPEVATDSIFSVIAEELGFIIVLGVLALFFTLLRRGFAIARTSPDAFGRYLAVGIAGGIVLQAIINISALTGLLPLTGITLPFVSAGGTSLLVTMAGIGILTNISKQTKS